MFKIQVQDIQNKPNSAREWIQTFINQQSGKVKSAKICLYKIIEILESQDSSWNRELEKLRSSISNAKDKQNHIKNYYLDNNYNNAEDKVIEKTDFQMLLTIHQGSKPRFFYLQDIIQFLINVLGQDGIPNQQDPNSRWLEMYLQYHQDLTIIYQLIMNDYVSQTQNGGRLHFKFTPNVNLFMLKQQLVSRLNLMNTLQEAEEQQLMKEEEDEIQTTNQLLNERSRLINRRQSKHG